MRKKYEKIDRRSVFSKINSKGAIGACAPEIAPKRHRKKQQQDILEWMQNEQENGSKVKNNWTTLPTVTQNVTFPKVPKRNYKGG